MSISITSSLPLSIFSVFTLVLMLINSPAQAQPVTLQSGQAPIEARNVCGSVDFSERLPCVVTTVPLTRFSKALLYAELLHYKQTEDAMVEHLEEYKESGTNLDSLPATPAAFIEALDQSVRYGSDGEPALVDNGTFNPLGGFSSQALVVGAAKLLRAQAETELTRYAVQQAHGWFEEAPASLLFPSVKDMLGLEAATERSYTVSEFGRHWQTALQEDLVALPRRLAEETLYYKLCTDATDSDRCAQTDPYVRLSFRIADGTMGREAPAVIVEDLYRFANSLPRKPHHVLDGLQLSSLVAEDYRITLEETPDALKDFRMDLRALHSLGADSVGRDALIFYFRLLAADLDNTDFKQAINALADRALADEAAAATVLALLRLPVETLDRAHRLAEASRPVLDAQPNFREYLATMSAILAMAEPLAALQPNAQPSESFRTSISVCDRMVNLLYAVETRQFALATQEFLLLYNLATDKHAPSEVVKAVTLAHLVAEAESADEMKAAFQTVVAPVGGWRAKRPSNRHLLTVNAYLGGTVGYEQLTEAPGNPGAATAGIFAPIGLEYTPPGSDFGLFLSVVDLGAVVRYDFFKEGEVDTYPEVGIDQVFAPGLFLRWGRGDSPFAIGGGIQTSPDLRSVDGTSPETGPSDAIRILAFLGIDLVLFEF